MRRLLKSLTLLLGVSFSVHSQMYLDMAMDTSMTFEEITVEAELFYDEHGRGAHSGYKSFKRWEYWTKRCLNASGKMMTNALVYEEFGAFEGVMTGGGVRLDRWEELGPFEVENTSTWSSHIGRITSMGMDHNDENHFIVGSPTGGIWKTKDGGQNWSPIFDYEAILKIYSLAINPHNSNEYYAGTWGGGILRSKDRGATWAKVTGVPTGSRIIRIEIDPVDSNILLAINEGGNIFRSQDAGDNWSSVHIAQSTLYDIAFHPTDHNIIYASGTASLFKSTNAGLNFNEVDGPWKTSGMTFNPLMLAVTPAAPNFLYVLEADNGGFGALYRSDNAGLTFNLKSSNADGTNNLMGYSKLVKGGQAPRDMALSISPSDPHEIHIGGVMTFRSLNGGINWQQTTHWIRNNPLPFIHADVDFMLYKGNRLYIGTDGGLFYTEDKGLSFVDLSTGLNIRQFYRMDIDGDIIVAGSQDNGMGKYTDKDGWIDFLGADGMEPLIDKDNSDEIYASIQFGNIYKSSDGGWTLIGGFNQSPGQGDWVTPLEQDPKKSKTLFQGKQQLHKSSDGAVTWNPISNFNQKNPSDSLMQEIDVFKSDGDYIVCGFEEQVYRTTNGGQSWTDISPDFSFSNVNYINIHPHDKNWIALTLSGTDNRIVQTTDGGVTWTNLMGNLPDIGTECVIYEGGPLNGMYLSMDPGVFYKNLAQPEWQLISDNIPNVRTTELEISGCDLYATTFGRGLWRTDIMDNTPKFADADNDGYGDESTAIPYCDAPPNYIFNGGDCDDNNKLITEDSENVPLVYKDEDGDGYGSGEGVPGCMAPAGYVNNANDCNDQNNLVYPNAQELCDGIDNNCDDILDDAQTTYYLDNDNDGYGDEQNSINDCTTPNGYVANYGDCNDNNPLINPGQLEICDGIDNNCDGVLDADFEPYYLDSDGDGYGQASISVMACAPVNGYVNNHTDCDDNDPTVNPESIEQCDDKDNDCDGLIDEICGGSDCTGAYLIVHTFIKDTMRAYHKFETDAVIGANRAITITAGKQIQLLPNFEVANGSEFQALIKPCMMQTNMMPIDGGLLTEVESLEHNLRKAISFALEPRLNLYDVMDQLLIEGSDVNIKNLLLELPTGIYTIELFTSDKKAKQQFTWIKDIKN